LWAHAAKENEDIAFTRTQNKIEEIGDLRFWKYQSRRASAKSSLLNPEDSSNYNFVKSVTNKSR